MRSQIAFTIVAAALGSISLANAQNAPSQAKIDAAVASMFSGAAPEWQQRVEQDETQKICSQFRNEPPAGEAEKIMAHEKATIKYPPDRNVLGDWRKGEKVAQTGTGGQFSDTPDTYRGGNCYACHQLDKAEVSYGTLGPSLAAYGRVRNFAAEANVAAYEKIFNSQSVRACSTMPRFGYHNFLSIDQIRDVTAYLMSPDSPVNK
jgi:sulfur-oxidizing protein SoxX